MDKLDFVYRLNGLRDFESAVKRLYRSGIDVGQDRPSVKKPASAHSMLWICRQFSTADAVLGIFGEEVRFDLDGGQFENLGCDADRGVSNQAIG